MKKTITMQSKLSFLVDYPDKDGSLIRDPRYEDCNGRTLQDLHDNYERTYISRSNIDKIVFDTAFSLFSNGKSDYQVIYDISKPSGEKYFCDLALKIGDETDENGIAKLYILTWEITNPIAKKAARKFDLQNFKVKECQNARFVLIE
ncbi:MAG: hypothetical protein IKN12_05240 [Selenomonadaceae bacterium]|nr:hypothetical protein [Selenomonadaceae bacterium]